MAYSRAFFEFQLTVADRLATKFDLVFADAVYAYTTFTVSFRSDDWTDYNSGLEQASDPTDWIYQWYLERRQPDPTPEDTLYYKHPLFGCFYYSVRDGTVIRPHFINNDLPGMRLLSGTSRLPGND